MPYQPLRLHRDETIVLRGMRCHLRRWGTPGGQPILLLHGWMDCAATFQFLIDAAPETWLNYDLIAPDWRGFGESEWAKAGYYFPDYLADLEALIDQLAPDQPVILIGHSMGGIVASLYAGIRPARVLKLVSLEGFGLQATQPEQAPKRYARWLDEQNQTPDFTKPLTSLTQITARLCRTSPALTTDQAVWLAQALTVSQAADLRYRADPRHKGINPVLYRLEEAKACWRAVTAPTLWVAGDEAKLLAWLNETSTQFAERIACFTDLQYEAIAGCGHNLHHDAPAQLARLIDTFLLAND